MISSQKYYGQGETLEIDNWEDLKKLEDLTSNPKDSNVTTSAKNEL